jgi:hypothetical protein
MQASCAPPVCYISGRLSIAIRCAVGPLVSGGLLFLRGGFGARVGGGDDGGDAAAGAEVAYDNGPDGVAGFDDVVENLVDDVFLEDAQVAVGEEILLEGLEFEAALAGHVADGETAEVGETRFGADAGELGIVHEDLVGLELVLPGFDGGEGGVEAGFGVVVGVAGGVRVGKDCGAHASILSCLAWVLLDLDTVVGSAYGRFLDFRFDSAQGSIGVTMFLWSLD